MKPDTHTVTQLFERDVRYIVPLYQRPYVWDADHQWAPLWDDVTALLQHQEDSDLSGLWSRFLGAIVVEQDKTVPGEIPRLTVIDGQQRLTTLQLLIAAAAKSVAASGAENDAALLRELAVNNPRKASGTERLKVWPTNANRAAFTAVMSPDGPPPGHVDDPGNRIDEAFAYFTVRIAEYIAGTDEDAAAPSEVARRADAGRPEVEPRDGQSGLDPAVAARAKRLRITLCDLLKVVSITLADDDNAQIIFETLNARGTPLLALDLVKNAIFHQAARQGRDTDVLYEQVWRPQLDDEYWRQERRQGRLNRPIAELFLMHWLTMRLDRLIPATELFATSSGCPRRPPPAAARSGCAPDRTRRRRPRRGNWPGPLRTDFSTTKTRSTDRRANCGNRTLRISRSHAWHDHKLRHPPIAGKLSTPGGHSTPEGRHSGTRAGH